MATATPAPNNGLTGSAPLYTQVEPLNPEVHGKLGVKRLDAPFAFASGVHFVPLLLQEFPAACGSYPIIFAGDEKQPLAVMGLEPGTNLFFDKTGAAKPEIYLPAYVRRFPFIVAHAEDNVIVCLDVDADIVSEDGEMKIFEGKELTEYGKNCVEYCRRFEDDRIRSDQILNQIKALDIFHLTQAKHQPRDGQGNPVGEEVVVSEYFAIEEPKLHKLSGDQLAALRDTGALAYIYAHLVSAWKWEGLISMQLKRQMDEAAANAA